MIICHSRKYLFIHVHKTAGESVTHALSGHLARGDLILGSTPGGKMASMILRQRTPLKKHSAAQDVRDHLGREVWDGYFTFAFVRHPVDRIRSLYGYYGKLLAARDRTSLRNMLYALPGSRFRDPLNWPASGAFLETSSFSEFIRHPGFSPRHPGTRPQWEAVCDAAGGVLVDFVGRYEALEADFGRALERIGLADVRLPRRNASRAPEAVLPVAAEDRAYLGEIYRRDFEIFGYAAAEPVGA